MEEDSSTQVDELLCGGFLCIVEKGSAAFTLRSAFRVMRLSLPYGLCLSGLAVGGLSLQKRVPVLLSSQNIHATPPPAAVIGAGIAVHVHASPQHLFHTPRSQTAFFLQFNNLRPQVFNMHRSTSGPLLHENSVKPTTKYPVRGKNQNPGRALSLNLASPRSFLCSCFLRDRARLS